MRNKLVATALVLGFSFAPMSAFSSDLTTIQGGTPTYSCPQGADLVGNTCVKPSTNKSTQISIPAQISSTYHYEWFQGGVTFTTDNGISVPQGQSFQSPVQVHTVTFYFNGYKTYPVTNFFSETINPAYSCPDNTYTLLGTNCLKTQQIIIPSTTTPASVSGSSGGSLIASVSGFLSPVWEFIQTKLLPAIGSLVLLGIGVRLSIKAVRKYSKVA